MTEIQVKAFLRDIAAVMKTHNIEGITGLWFGSDETHGQLVLSNVTDTRLMAIMTAVADRWEAFLVQNGLEKKKFSVEIKDLYENDPDKN